MEKIDLAKFPEYKGDFVPLPDGFRPAGTRTAHTKNGDKETLVVVSESGLTMALFPDQLRVENGKILVSQAHLERQMRRQEEFAASKKA